MGQTPAKVDLLQACTLYLLYDSHINVIQPNNVIILLVQILRQNIHFHEN